MNSWNVLEAERTGSSICFSLANNGKTASWLEVLDAMRTDPTFRDVLSGVIVASPFDQVFWETLPVNTESCNEPFQFALTRAGLSSKADSASFSEFFTSQGRVATFANLSGSAVLVAPAPMPDKADRSYLKPFLATAPAAQVHELWMAVGAAVSDRLSNEPVWVSTSGGGVPWLHVRLDSSPKYYSYAPFRAWPSARR